MFKVFIRGIIAVFTLVAGCGQEARNPYEANIDNIAILTPARFSIERKVVGSGGAGFIVGDDTPVDFELWFYDAADAPIATFPFRLSVDATGVSAYAWSSVKTNLKIKDFTDKTVRSVLGTYVGRRSGVTFIGGQSALKVENESGVKLRVITDRIGVGIDLSAIRLKLTQGVTEHAYSWDSIVRMTEPEQNW